jgi:hypothetical protein
MKKDIKKRECKKKWVTPSKKEVSNFREKKVLSRGKKSVTMPPTQNRLL